MSSGKRFAASMTTSRIASASGRPMPNPTCASNARSGPHASRSRFDARSLATMWTLLLGDVRLRAKQQGRSKSISLNRSPSLWAYVQDRRVCPKSFL